VRAVPRAHLIGATVAAGAVLALAVAVLASGGGHRAAHPPRARPSGQRPALIAGAPLQRARCAQWQRGTPAQQRAVVDALAATVGGPSGNTHGTTLPTTDALALFDRACASPVARNFVLYQIYIQAAAFSSMRAPST
jgi:hypothetical protein